MGGNADEIRFKVIMLHESKRANMGDKAIKCPICRKDTHWENNPFRPFCSERCRLMDLGKWASEDYRIPDGKKAIREEERKKNKQEGR